MICEGRIVIVTGGGRGIGRAEAIGLADQGAKVVVNNRSAGAAEEAVALIRKAGGEAVVHVGDVSDFDVASGLVETAIKTYGGLDVLVNNAGIVRDRMLVKMSPEEWDDAIRVNLRGTFAPLSQAARYWRDVSKVEPRQASVVNTTSAAGLYGNVGQVNYGAAKAGIANLTINASVELARYGVTVNAVAPAAATDMSEHLIDPAKRDINGFDPYASENIAPLISWLASLEARNVTGRIFNVKGGYVSVAEGWRSGPEVDIGRKWAPEEVGTAMIRLVSQAMPNPGIDGKVRTDVPASGT